MPVHLVAPTVMRALADTASPRGVVAVLQRNESTLDELRGGDLTVVLASIQNPGNAGTLVRSAVAAGATGVVFTEGAVDAFSPKTVRASAGTIFRTRIVRGGPTTRCLEELRVAQRIIAAASGGVDATEVDLTQPFCLVLGNEAAGLPPEVVAHADVVAGIPLAGGAESLNVAVAGSIILFEAARQRRQISSERHGR